MVEAHPTSAQLAAGMLSATRSGRIFGVIPPLGLALVAFGLLPLLLLVTGQAEAIRIVFPLAAVAVGGLLYWKAPASYLGLTMWLFFVTPFVRRVVDEQEGWQHVSPIMLAPYLAAALSGVAAVSFAFKADRKQLWPFALIGLSIAYGFALDISNGRIASGAFSAVRWSVPVLVAIFLIHHRALRDQFVRVVLINFTVALPLLGLYGASQFAAPTPWDVYWMQETPGTPFGSPEPFELRVFSTMNSPQPLAMAMAAGILLFLCLHLPKHWFLAAPGFVALVLTMSRTVVGALACALIFLIAAAPPELRVRALRFALAAGLAAVPALLFLPGLSDRVLSRVEQTLELGDDGSAQSRANQYAHFPELVLRWPLGDGLSWKGTYSHLGGGDRAELELDSGIIETVVGLGVLGALAYFAALFALLRRLLQRAIGSGDPLLLAAAAVAVCAVAQLPLQHAFINVMGFFAWLFVGLGLAERQQRASTRRRVRRRRTPAAEDDPDFARRERERLRLAKPGGDPPADGPPRGRLFGNDQARTSR